MSLTLAEAATQVGLNRSTLLRAIKAGKISGTRDDAGAWHVEPAELFRVFEAVPAPSAAEAQPQHALADALVAELRARLADMQRTIEDVRQDRDRAIANLQRERDEWREEAKRLTLPAPSAMRAEATPPTTQQGSGDAGEIPLANEPVRDAAVPQIAAGAAQGRLLRTWRWLRSTG
jgi:excisionase family DNA binding protein